MPDALSTAIALLLALLTGPLATALATIAVAGLGLALLAGRVMWRRAARVALGCALVFGAGGIAGGLLGLAPAAGTPDMTAEMQVPPVAPLSAAPLSAAPLSAAPLSAGQPLANAYAAARQAVGIRFPAARGTVRLTATLAPDGHLARLDARGDGLDPEVLGTVAQIVTASGLMFPAGTPSQDLPPLPIGPR